MRNKKCGMKECKFTPNLKSLIESFSSKITHLFFLNCNFLKCLSDRFSIAFAENFCWKFVCLTEFILFVLLCLVSVIFAPRFLRPYSLLVKGRIFYSAISEVNCLLAFFYSTYYDFLGVQYAFFCSPFFYHNQFFRLK